MLNEGYRRCNRHGGDVLLGLFFVGIGMLFDPASLPDVWHLALAGAAALLSIKTLLVAQMVRWAGSDTLTAWRTGLLLAVGGEFGFALLALALTAGVIDRHIGQAALTAVLFSMILAASSSATTAPSRAG